MSAASRMSFRTAFLTIVLALLAAIPAMAQDQPKQTFDVKGEYVRLVYNDEGWVVVGYRVANGSVGEEWMLLELGVTVREGVKDQTLSRESLTLTTPGGVSIPLATQEEFSKASLRALDARANMTRDSINYFPLTADKPCRIGFFTDIAEPGRGMAYDVVELSYQRACVGRAYFKIPGGITYGLHFLNVKFAGSTVNVPVRIMTKDELKENKAKWEELQKQLKQQQKSGG